jgi:hypothetical protein
MQTLLLLVLPHRKWKPCLSLLCVTENGNPVPPCFASQKMETLFHRAIAHKKSGNPLSPCFASQKKQPILFS